MDNPLPSSSGIGTGNRNEKLVKKFNYSWLDIDIFKNWLMSHSDDAKAYCTVCKKVLACGKSELTRHANRKRHKLNMKKCQENNDNKKLKNKVNNDTSAELLTDQFENLTHSQKVKRAEIKLSAFLAEHNIAIHVIDHLVPLLKDICCEPQVVKDLSLSVTKCTQIIKNVIAKRENEKTVDILKENKFSILIDESTTISNDKILNILVKYVDPESKKSVTELLDLLQLDAKDCSAEKIYSAFKNCLENKQIFFTNIIGMACDNAAVMIGINDSFFTKLKKEIPNLILLKCICHSSALIASRACSKLPSNCEYLLHAVANYISNSPKRSAILCEYQQYFGVKSCKILKLSSTRWLVLQKCAVRLLNNWEALKHYFYLEAFESKNKSATEILDHFNNNNIKAYMLFLKYSLDYFNSFNALFQSRKILIYLLASRSEQLIKQVGQHFLVPKALENISVNIVNSSNFVPLCDVNVGSECEQFLRDKNVEFMEDFKSKCLDFYVTACQEMIKRLPFNNTFFRSLQFLHPDFALRDEKRSAIKDLTDIAEHFGSFDTTALASEWVVLPNMFSDAEKDILANLDIHDMWSKILQKKDCYNESFFPNLQQLIYAVLSLPHSNAEAERIFSIVTDVKNKKRNRLNIKTLYAICKTRSVFQAQNIDCRSFQIDSRHFELYNSQNLYAQ